MDLSYILTNIIEVKSEKNNEKKKKKIERRDTDANDYGPCIYNFLKNI